MKNKLFALAALTVMSSSAMALETGTGSANFTANTVVPVSCIVSDMVGSPDIAFGSSPATEFGSFSLVSNVDGQVTYKIADETTGLQLVETGEAPAFNDKTTGLAFVQADGTTIHVNNAQVVTMDKGKATVEIGIDTDLGAEVFVATGNATTTATVTFSCPDGV